MLDRALVAKQLQQSSDALFYDSTNERNLAFKTLKSIASNKLYPAILDTANFVWPLVRWHAGLDDVFTVEPCDKAYRVLAVDGSQIYPDRHRGYECFLINIGVVELSYKVACRRVWLDSFPRLFTPQSDLVDQRMDEERVNCHRTEHELLAGIEHALVMREQTPDALMVFFVDGSLIFWHLDSKEPEVKQRFLTSYLILLERFYQARIPLAGYISCPKSRDLIHLAGFELTRTGRSQLSISLDRVVDAAAVQNLLQVGERTTIFASQSSIVDEYPDHLKPHFCYLNVGDEVVRIEFPAWVAQDQEQLDFILSVCIDQAQKGQGYPVSLAEAHEQAVVKGHDREVFFRMLDTMARRHLGGQASNVFSRKLLRKRRIGV